MVEWFQVLVGLTVLASVVVFPLAMGIVVAVPAVLPRGVCVSCGYSLVGLPAHGVCPECGEGHAGTMATVPTHDWQTPAELRSMRVITVLLALAVQLTAMASMTLPRNVVTIAVMLLAAAAASAPPLLLSVFTPPSVSRAAAWTISVVGVLPGAALGAWILCDASERQGPPDVLSALIVTICASGAAGSCCGVAAITVTLFGMRRIRTLERHRRAALANERARLLGSLDKPASSDRESATPS